MRPSFANTLRGWQAFSLAVSLTSLAAFAAPAHAGDLPAAATPAGDDKPCGDCDHTGPHGGPHGKRHGDRPCDHHSDKGDGKPCGDCDHHGEKGDGKPCGDCEHGDHPGGGCPGFGPMADDDGDCPECTGDHHGRMGPHHGEKFGEKPGDGPGEAPRLPRMPPPMFELMHGWMKMLPRPTALLQMQSVLFAGDNAQVARGDRGEVPGFGLRRARVGVEGRQGRHLSYALSADLAANPQSNGGALGEAWFAIHAHSLELRVGAQHTPFLQEALLSSGHLSLAERSFSANAMAPFRQVGATLSGHYKLAGLEWYVGAYNAFERDKNFYQGLREFSGFNGNRFGGLAFVGRISAAPLGKMGKTIYDAEGGKLRLAIGASAYTSDAGAARMNAYSADLHAKFMGAHLLVQYIYDTSDPKEQPTDTATLNNSIKRSALTAELGYAFRRLNAAVRYERIDPETSRDDNLDGQVISAALGMQLPGDRMRVQAQFDHRQETNGPALANDVAFLMFQLLH
ncbi:MAG: hypothetical protein HY902_03365 [Deltaproteobacteria bacterium]|nr:hypothetical protein [Deltaproteobacteria bacterium]